MRITVFGATGATGRLVVQRALDGDLDVTAFTRSPDAAFDPPVRIAHGDARDPVGVRAAIADADAVISVLGIGSRTDPTTDLSDATRIVIAAMADAGVRRIVTTANASVFNDEPVAAPYAVAAEEHRRDVAILRDSALDWTVAAPPWLKDDPRKGPIGSRSSACTRAFDHARGSRRVPPGCDRPPRLDRPHHRGDQLARVVTPGTSRGVWSHVGMSGFRSTPDRARDTARPPLVTPTFVLVTCTTFAYFIAVGVLLPTLPLYVRGPLGGGSVEVGIVVGAFAVTSLVLRPFAGRVGDARGRRILLLVGGALTALSGLGYVAAGSVATIVAFRLLAGVAEACFFVGAAAAINDLAPIRGAARR